MSAVSRSSSSRPRGILRCVERCCPSAAQARRSEIDSACRTCSMQARRRAGLSSFPAPPPAGSAYPRSDPTPHAVLRLEILQAFYLVAFQPAELLAPAIIRHLAYPDRADRLGHALTLRGQHINLPQLGDDLFGLVALPRHCSPPCEQKT